jgi:NTE family protein
MVTNDKIGLALGGGAARGIAHIGVIEVLERQGVPFHMVSGTSMGAIVGAVYLMEGSTSRLINRMYDFVESEAFKEADFEDLRERKDDEDDSWFESMTGMIKRGYKYSLSVTRQSVISKEIFSGIINELVPDIRIEDLPSPFSAVSLDVVSGKEYIWSKGSLRNALWATSAIPGFFPPLEIDGMVLVDGAWTNSVPVHPCSDLGATKVIAVDISREVEELAEYKRGISLMMRSALVASRYLRQLQLKEADVVIRPDVGNIHWADFSNLEEVIQKGRDSACVCLEEACQLVRKPSVWDKFTIPDTIKKSIRDKISLVQGISQTSSAPSSMDTDKKINKS